MPHGVMIEAVPVGACNEASARGGLPSAKGHCLARGKARRQASCHQITGFALLRRMIVVENTAEMK